MKTDELSRCFLVARFRASVLEADHLEEGNDKCPMMSLYSIGARLLDIGGEAPSILDLFMGHDDKQIYCM
jgi:hypothetical protein